MVKFIAIILTCALIAASHAERQVFMREFPAVAQIVIAPGNRIGDGTILNINHVITVAQNVFHHEELTTRLAPADVSVRVGLVIVAGANPPATLPVQRIFAHPNYNFHTRKYDVAVLRMENNFEFTPDAYAPNIAPIELNNRIIPEGQLCQFIGFRLFAPGTVNLILMEATLPVQSRTQCNGLENPSIRGNVHDQHICLGLNSANPVTCMNNVGAALYCGGRLAALRVAGRECNTVNSPAVMIQTRWFADWIPQQFNRTDNPAAGPVGPPGAVPTNNGAVGIMISTTVIICGLIMNLGHF